MYRFWKRAVSVILSVVLMVTLLPQAEPTAVSAAETLQSAPEYNRDIINALSDIVGGEEEAQAYYQMLQSYGLIDDEGNILDKWKIEMDGKEISLDEIKEILAGDFDPNKVVWVDGTPVALGELEKMIAIEECLAYVKETYFTEREWTSEQVNNAQSLISQLEKEGIILRTANETPTSVPVLLGASGMNHDARVTVIYNGREEVKENGQLINYKETFLVSLTHAEKGQTVSFKYSVESGSITATLGNTIINNETEDTNNNETENTNNNETENTNNIKREEAQIELTAGESGSASAFIDVYSWPPDPLDEKNPLWSSESTFCLNCHAIKNALFKDSKGNDRENLGIEAKCAGTTDQMPGRISFSISGNTGDPADDYITETKLISGPAGSAYVDATKLDERFKKTGTTVKLTTGQSKLIEWGLVDTVEIGHKGDEELNLLDPYANITGQPTTYGRYGYAWFGNYIPWPVKAENDKEGESANILIGYTGNMPTVRYSGIDSSIYNAYGENLNGTDPYWATGRVIQTATHQFIINYSDGAQDHKWYNKSVGYRPSAKTEDDYLSWFPMDATNGTTLMVPTGGYDVAKDSKKASLGELKGKTVKSFTFDGGFAYYPFRLYDGLMLNTAGSYSRYFTVYTIWPSAIGTQFYAPSPNWEDTFYRSDLYSGSQAIQEVRPINKMMPDHDFSYDISVNFSRNAASEVESITASEGTFYPGELIPIIVRYSEPANPNAVLIVNGKALTPSETSASNVQTFYYEVEENGAAGLVIRGLVDKKDLLKKAIDNITDQLNTLPSDPSTSEMREKLASASISLTILKAQSKVQGIEKYVDLNDAKFLLNDIGVKDLDGDRFKNDFFKNSQTVSPGKTIMDPGVKIAVFTGMTLDVDRSVPGVPTLTATVGVTSDESMTEWINSDFESDGNNKFLSKSFRIRIIANDGSYDSRYLRPYSTNEKISGKFITTGPIEVPVNETGKERYFTAELYIYNGETVEFKDAQNPTTEELDPIYDPVIRKVSVTVDGQEVLKDTGIESAALASMKFVTKDDITVGVSVRVSDESKDYDYHQDENGEYILADDNPVLKASFDLKGDGYDFGDISNVTVYDYDASGNKSLHDSTAHFVWESSAPNIADINANGTISIKNKSGTATFYLTALNGGKVRKDSNGHNLNVIVKAGEFRFVGSNNPFLKVDDVNYIHIASGPSLTVQMSTNLNEKVSSGAAFNIEVFRGSDTSVQPEYSDTLVVEQNESLSRVIIPSEALAYDYSLGATNDFKIRISTTYENDLYEGFARVTVESPPAVVRLGRLQDYYILDSTGTLGITWEINNFDRFASGNSADLFELSIKKDGVEIVDPSYKNDPGFVENGHCSGVYELSDLSFDASSNRSGYRQIYDVSIKAKNGAESTWSTDSCLIYVYDADALKIWIQPTSDIEKKRGAVGTQITGSGSTDSSLTMSNVSTISAMTQDEIIALKRDISLRNVISANYGEYAWTELADQLEWASSNNGVASINYKQGDLYEDISRNLAKIYTSYRPATDFLVSGLSNGETNITAKHVLTGMTDTLTVDVETLKDKLYLFQCYPQVETTLTYTDKQGNTATVTSDANGAAAIYDPEGIGSDVYCRSTFEGHVYLGTFFNKDIESGERDSTKLELYPCNNVKLRRAAYAYVYVKNADGTPYNGYIMIRGGVNVNGNYVSTAKFAFNSTGAATHDGYSDNFVRLGSDGKLEVIMDQSQFGLDREINAQDSVSYEFIISGSDNGTSESTKVYPLYVYVDSGKTEESFVGSGEAVVTFRNNKRTGRHPFILGQFINSPQTGKASVLDATGKVGISDTTPTADLETLVMWWGEDYNTYNDYKLGIYVKDGPKTAVGSASGQSEQFVTGYPFIAAPITSYTIHMNAENLNGFVGSGEAKGLYMEYYRKSGRLTKQEELSFSLVNLIGVGKVEESRDLKSSLAAAGKSVDSNAGVAGSMDFGDKFVNGALQVMAAVQMPGVAGSFLSLDIVPTSDPTKFLGLMKFDYSTMDDPPERVDGVGASLNFLPGDAGDNLSYTPGFQDLPWSGGEKWVSDFQEELSEKSQDELNSGADFSYEFGGYMETLIYYDYNLNKWQMQVLDGGFNAGFGVEFAWNLNFMAGPVPLTLTVGLGGQIRISMDAVTVDYYNFTQNRTDFATEYLTKLRIYLYVKVFAGIGVDYSVLALKLGIFGQIGVDMEFEWLNRPYVTNHHGEVIASFANQQEGYIQRANLDGQRYVINGMIGLEVIAKLAFISYEEVLFSVDFQAMDERRSDYNRIEMSWANNQANLRQAIDALTNTGSASVSTFGGQQLLNLSLAPRVESRDYLEDKSTPRVWGEQKAPSPVMKTAMVIGDNKVSIPTIETNTYPYANPKLVSGSSGSTLYWLSDMNSADVNDTSAVSASKSSGSGSWTVSGTGRISADLEATDDTQKGFGDMLLDAAADGRNEISAWSRRMVDNGKVAGETITTGDQLVSLYGTEIFAKTSDGTTLRLTDNSTPDLAPAVAVNGEFAVVAWRNVAMAEDEGSAFNITDFNKKDTILYKMYNFSSHTWSETKIAYNGTSGAVKALKAAILDNGTAAIAYTVDTEGNDASGNETTDDREIFYTLISNSEVARTVRATNDSVLDENPDITVVRFEENGEESFVLGWYSHKAVGESGNTGRGDLCMLDFDASGKIGGRLPGSLSQMAGGKDISVTSNFMFTSGADTIDTLSITWVERAGGKAENLTGVTAKESISVDKPEYDILKAAKFYSYGTGNENIGLTSVINVAEMPEGTLIDTYDIVQKDDNRIDAVILGTTYGEGGAATQKSAVAQNGETVTYIVPKAVSNMYEVSESYGNKVSVPRVYVDSETVKRASTIGAQFSIRNDGRDPITELKIDIAGQQSTFDDLVLLPGASTTLIADYRVPADVIRDVNYTVTATYKHADQSEETKTADGTINLYRPDLAISSAEIVSEENGKRVINIKLNNTQDSALAGSGRKVGLSFYTDATMKEEMDESFIRSVVIEDDASLKMIDEGGYSIMVTFDAAAYVDAMNNADDEIPENGIGIYISANILEEKKDFKGKKKLVAVTEPVMNNNAKAVTCENLKVRTGKDVIMTSDMEVVDGKTVVNVEVQNTSIGAVTEGNLIVSLLDEDGNVLDQKQSYTGAVSNTAGHGKAAVAYTSMSYGTNRVSYTALNNGLISLGKEEKASETFIFDMEGASVDVSYSNLKLDADNAELSSLWFSNIPEINESSFILNNSGDYAAEVTLGKVSSTSVIASAAGALARVTIDGSDEEQPATPGTKNTENKTIKLVPKEEGSTVTVTVTADDGTAKRFVLKISYTPEAYAEENKNSGIFDPELIPSGEEEPTPAPTPEPYWDDSDQSMEETVTSTPTPEVKKDEKEKKETKTEKVVKAPAAERKANTVKLDKKLGVTEKNGKLSFTWGKVPDAEYYELYVVYDDEEFSDAEPIVVEDAIKFSLKKIDGKKINQKKNIKYKVVAFKTENGKKVQLGESLTLCAAGTKSKEYTNVSEVTLNKTKKTLETGKTFKIKADLKLEDESKKLVDPGIKYESSDTSVAKVSSKGKITTVGKGTCYVYVRSATGAYAKIKITVK